MLIIVSDIHLGDGTCGKPITPAAFQLFADRLKELAHNSSQRMVFEDDERQGRRFETWSGRSRIKHARIPLPDPSLPPRLL